MKQSLLSQGSFFKWVAVQRVDWTRTGQFTEGTFVTSYRATVAGHPVIECTGAFGMVMCGVAK